METIRRRTGSANAAKRAAVRAAPSSSSTPSNKGSQHSILILTLVDVSRKINVLKVIDMKGGVMIVLDDSSCCGGGDGIRCC
jgi:hypothetical protein